MSDHREAKYTHLPAYVMVHSSTVFTSQTITLPDTINNYRKVWLEDWVIDGVPVQGITDFPVDTHFLLRIEGDLDRNHHSARFQNNSHLHDIPIPLTSLRTVKNNADPILIYRPEDKAFPVKSFSVKLLTPTGANATFTACLLILKFD